MFTDWLLYIWPTMNSKNTQLQIPPAPRNIGKGSTLRDLLSEKAIDCLARNISYGYPKFDRKAFKKTALADYAPLSILARGHHLSHALHKHLPPVYDDAIEVLLNSLTPPMQKTDQLGLAVFFYLPHVFFVANYGLDAKFNAGRDPFKTSMRAQYELTRRYSAEYSIRHFLIRWPDRTLKLLKKWTNDPDPHVRRLCSEGTRPKLPWAVRLPQFVKDPTPTLPILQALKDDPDLYVRRSVANHVGDIAKDHLPLALKLCREWLEDASDDRRWVIRHALRYPAKKGVKAALSLRKAAK